MTHRKAKKHVARACMMEALESRQLLAVSLTAAGYTQNFDTFDGTSAASVPAGFTLAGSSTFNGAFTCPSSAYTTTNAWYAGTFGTDRAIANRCPAGSPWTMTFDVQNNTGASIPGINIAYDVKQFCEANPGVGSTIALDSNNGSGGTYDQTKLTGGLLTTCSHLADPTGAYATPLVTHLTASYNQSVAAGATVSFQFIWNPVGGGNRPIWGVDNVAISAAAPVVVAPTVTSISQSTGSVYGGYTVTVNGTSFVTGTTVKFGTTPATNIVLAGNGNSLTCTVPAGAAGASTITVSNGTAPDATLSGAFSYVINAPTITNIAPANGNISGGNTVTISGTNFVTAALGGTTTVTFGSNAATNVTPSADGTSLTCTVPAGSVGTATVTVSNGTAPNATTSYQYTATSVSVTGLSATTGPSMGGTSITITGAGFTGATAVSFGGTAQSTFTVVSDTQITCKSPAHAIGTVDVTVTAPGGTSTTSASDRFAYTATTIAIAESLASGTVVTVDSNPVITTIISQPGTFGGKTFTTWSFLIQDATGSMMVYSLATSLSYTPAVGNTITVSGKNSPYQQMPELGTITAISTTGTATVPAVQVLTIPNVNLATLPATVAGYPMTIQNLLISGIAGPFAAANLTGTITDSAHNNMTLYYSASYSVPVANFSGKAVPQTPVDLTGYVVVYTSGSNNTAEFIPLSMAPSAGVYESYAMSAATSTVARTASTVTVTFSRTSSNSNLADSATATYTLVDGTALFGTDYSAAAQTGTVTFAAGSATATLTVNILQPIGRYGSRNFSVKITNPLPGDNTRQAILISPSSETVTITDARTTDISAQSAYSYDGTILLNPAGSSIDSGTGWPTPNLVIEQKATQGLGVLSYNDPNDPSFSPFSPPSHVGYINSLALETYGIAGTWTSGTLNVYAVSNNSSDPWGMRFITTDPEGMGTQFGTKYLLGSISYNSNQSTTGYTAFPLTTLDPNGLTVLMNALNGHGTFRIVVTPGDANVSAGWLGLDSTYHMPKLDINYMVNAPPTIGSFTANPSGVAIGASTTLTAGNVAQTGGTVSSVAFYVESNSTAGLQIGSDTLIGSGTQSGSNWTYSYSTTGLAAGTYTLYAVATGTGSLTSVPATTTLTVNALPTIGSFTANPTPVTTGTNTTLTASNVAQANGSISSVVFYLESNSTAGLQIGADTLIGTGTQNGSNWTYNFSTTGLAAGTYTLYAVANGAGSLSTTASTTLTVNAQTPTIGTFTATTPVTTGQNSTLTASNVAQTGGTVSSVVFYLESNSNAGLQIGSDTLIGTGTQNGSTWTYNFSTTGLAAGTYTLYAVANGTGGLTTTATTTLTVNAQTPTIGTFTATTPVTTGQNSTLTASNVAQVGGTVSSVVFYLESNSNAGLQIGSDTLIGTGTKSGSNWTYNFSTTGLAAGTYTLYAVANGTGGLSTTASTTLVVNAQTPTIGTFTATTPVIAGQSSTLTASTVAQTGGTVSSVVFYLESNSNAGLQIGSDTLIGTGTKSGSNWTYSYSTSGLAAGTYTLYAVANGTGGLTAVGSTTLTVTPATPAWVGAGSVATWDAGTNTLTVTGPTTIVADPGGAAIINANGAAAVVTVQPTTSDKLIHLGGLQLTNGARAVLTSVGASRSPQNHRMLIVNAANFSVDSTSTLDLVDNDMVLRGATYTTQATLQQLLARACDGYAWDGTGITSSAARNDGTTALGYALNDGSVIPQFAKFGPGAGAAQETVFATDLLVKYTLQGDADLNGVVNADDYGYVDFGYGTNGGSSWVNGDFDYNGATNADDYGYIDFNYGNTTVL